MINNVDSELAYVLHRPVCMQIPWNNNALKWYHKNESLVFYEKSLLRHTVALEWNLLFSIT